MKTFTCLVAVVTLAIVHPTFGISETFGLDSLDLQTAEQGWGEPHANKSVDNHPLFIDGKRYERGFGTHANSTLRIRLNGKGERFSAIVGIDDEVGQRGSANFKVVGDGKTLWESGLLRGGDPAKEASVDLRGVSTLILLVDDADGDINYDHGDWADAKISMSEGKPEALARVPEPAVVLTPKTPAVPGIHGAKVVGARPGSPFLFQIPATGERPLTFSASKLPPGLQLDASNGQITGQLTERGTYTVKLRAKNSVGKNERALRIVGGDSIALTPPLGWNSWNGFGCDVT